MFFHSIWIVAAALSAGPFADTWQREYTQDEARAAHVIALWQFAAGSELEDASGQGHHLELVGARVVTEGKFGGGLQSFPGWPVSDQRHAAVTKPHPSLSPSGPFTIDLWLKPGAELPDRGNAHLLCKKYVSHHDYQLMLTPLQGKFRRLQLTLGFGNDSEIFSSQPLDWPADVWQHVAVTYDGAGTVRFYRNGATIGERSVPGRKSISAGPLPLTIGDRTGSLYGGFAGVLDQVRISQGVREFSPAALELAIPRRTYVRFEPAPLVTMTVTNRLATTLSEARVTVSGIGPAQAWDLPALEAGGTHTLTWPFDTSLRPDQYTLTARVEIPGPPPSQREASIPITLVARPLPYRMPVMMWGIGSPSEFERELPRMKELGFNQCLGFGADYDAVWKAGAAVTPTQPHELETARSVQQMLDTALAQNFGVAASLYAGYYLKQKPELSRVDRQGKPYARHDVNAALPGLVEFCERVGHSVGRTHGGHPAFVAALINSEVRDDAEISFSQQDHDRYRSFSGGKSIPDEVTTKYGLSWRSITNFPADRILPDDDPRLQFLHWYWTEGDGWNSLHSALHRGLKSELVAKNPELAASFYTWFDPAIRTMSVPGSGGEVDVLSQWTYTEPSPLRLAYFTDELFAMAELSPRRQHVMKMTQLFWYRSSSAPIRTGTEFIASPFDDHDPDAAYISLAPMHLRGAFWTKLSRPITGLMYHGWSALVPTDGTHAYRYTQPDLQTEFRRLHHDVLEPLGPTLLQVPARRTDVAYLDSFTSQMFARRGSLGYSHDEAYLTLLHAQLQPEVIFEETIRRRGLDGYRVLVLADCDVLPTSVANAIRQFQKRGGLVIGDPNLAPGIRADLTIPKFTRQKKAAEDKATIIKHAAELRKQLDQRYPRLVESSNPELITHVRSAGSSDYLFVINDQREAGNYVGQHGLVLDVGLPSEGIIRYRPMEPAAPAEPQPAASLSERYVYDLLEQRQVQVKSDGSAFNWPVTVGPCDGQLFLITTRPIAAVQITAPETTTLGQRVPIQITITDPATQPLDAVIPVRVKITDPHGRPAEFTGYYGAAQGRLTIAVDPASNDAPGVWTIRVKELASGQTATKFLRVTKP